MLQISTTDSEFYILPTEEVNISPVATLSPDDEAFYESIKGELDTLACDPPKQLVTKILNYSKSQDNF